MIFSVSQFPERDGDLRNYGNEALEVVKEYFGKERSSTDGNVFPLLVDAHELSHDFAQFKLTIREHDAGRMSFNDTCTIKEYPHLFPSFSRLAALALVIPVLSVPCERGFSMQNQIKTKGHSRLSDKHVDCDCLMLLAM